jgi:ABC-type enterochelin transport system substrate-binding protein
VNKPIIIGLAGKMRSGKTHVARYLHTEYGFPTVSFATALKVDVIQMGFDAQEVMETKPQPIRALLQAYGQARRHQDKDYWVKEAMDYIKTLRQSNSYDGPVVIDDVRFPNEVAAVTNAGGLVIRLDRPDLIRPDNEDPSETALDNMVLDHTVAAGEGDLDYLVANVVEYLWMMGVVPK